VNADLTPLLERQKVLRRQLALSLLGLAAALALIVAFFGLNAKSGVFFFFVFGGWGRWIGTAWRKYKRARAELGHANRVLAGQRALLRGSGERRDAAQGLAISEELPGGELSIGRGGELGERK
jgi:hypothetical protein